MSCISYFENTNKKKNIPERKWLSGEREVTQVPHRSPTSRKENMGGGKGEYGRGGVATFSSGRLN